jgi:hypothetical protein
VDWKVLAKRGRRKKLSSKAADTIGDRKADDDHVDSVAEQQVFEFVGAAGVEQRGVVR